MASEDPCYIINLYGPNNMDHTICYHDSYKFPLYKSFTSQHRGMTNIIKQDIELTTYILKLYYIAYIWTNGHHLKLRAFK